MTSGERTRAVVGGGQRRSEHRGAVEAVAAELFAAKGYAGTGVREIAARVGIDPALVIRYFGSKEKLFLRTMTMQTAFTQIAAEPTAGFGAALVDFLVGRVRGSERTTEVHIFAALLRASDLPAVREQLQQAIDEMILKVVSPRLAGPEVDLRSRLIATQVTGLLTALCVIEDPTLAQAPRDRIVEHYGRTIQILIDPH